MKNETFKQVWQELQHCDRAGNINALVEIVVERWDFLSGMAPELIHRVDRYLRETPHLLSSDSIRRLKKLECKLPEGAGLMQRIDDWTAVRLKPGIGRMTLPVVGENVGYMRDLVVKKDGSPGFSKSRLFQMDRVGAAVTAALGARLKCPMYWYPERYSYFTLDHKGQEDPRVEGPSLELALALALYSLHTNIPVPPLYSATAGVDRSGRIAAVDKKGLRAKLPALASERPFVRKVLVAHNQPAVTAPSGIELIRIGHLEEALRLVFPRERPLTCISGELVNVEGISKSIVAQYNDGMYDTCLENAARLIAYLEGEGRKTDVHQRLPALFTGYWRKGSCHCHKGEIPETFACLRKAERLYQSKQNNKLRLIPEENYQNMRINFGVSLKDMFQYVKAEQLHRKIDGELRRIKSPGHFHAKNLSSLSQLYLDTQRFKEAEALQLKALPMIPEKDRWRNYGYLAQIYTRWGRWREAWNVLKREKALMMQHGKKSPFYAYMQAEFFYRRGLSDKRRRSRDFSELHRLTEKEYPAIGDYPVGLIHKFDALAYLAEGDEEKGLKGLEKVALHFESINDPIMATTARVERALFFLKSERFQDARDDLTQIVAKLSSKAFKSYFKDKIAILKNLLKTRKVGAQRIADAVRALLWIKAAIPY
jgi:tetratricopeptide (TPR) repeat protein